MDNTKTVYVGESPMEGQPKKKLTFTIGEGAVTTEKLGDESVTPEKLSPRIMTEVIEPTYAELQQQINNINNGNLTEDFGDRTDLAITQNTLTQAINSLWTKIQEITGESLYGVTMTAVPNFFVSTEGCDITLTAHSSSSNLKFDKVVFYVDGEVVGTGNNTTSYTTTIFTDHTITVRCVATILGVPYPVEKVITYYKAFWLGAGTHYSQVMKMEHLIPLTDTMRGAYNVTCAANDYIYVIMGESMIDTFLRADINGFELQFNQELVTVDGNQYYVLKSVNQFKAGTYNVDING